MGQSADEIVAAAMTLPPDLRVKIAERLLDSVEPVEQAQIDGAWLVEIERRLQDLDQGRAHTIPADEVFRSIDARLKS